MRTQITFGTLIAATALIVPISAQQTGETEKDRKALIGKWQIVRLDGVGLTKDQVALFQMVITEKEIRIQDGDELEVVAFKLDSTKKPAHIDLTSAEKDGKTVKGIYELAGDSLKICIVKGGLGDRPASFDPKMDYRSMELKREKK